MPINVEEKILQIAKSVSKLEGQIQHLATKADLAEFIQDHMESCPLVNKNGTNKSLVAIIATLASAVAAVVTYFTTQ